LHKVRLLQQHFPLEFRIRTAVEMTVKSERRECRFASSIGIQPEIGRHDSGLPLEKQA
jgi:hypothetical protein